MELDLNFIKNATEKYELNLNINSLVNIKNEKHSNSIINFNRESTKMSNSIILSVINLDYYKEKYYDDQTSITINNNKIKNHSSVYMEKKTKNTFVDYFGADDQIVDKVEKKKKKYKEIRIKITKINNFLSKIFKNRNLFEKDYILDENEIKLIYLILKKKFFKKSSFKILKVDLKNLKNLIIFIKNNNKSQKRVEEMNKFIFKLTLKQLKKNFYLKNCLIQSEENEIKFFEEFFPTEMDENISKNLLEGKNKKLNNSVLKILFKNQNFKTKFINYLENGFYNDYLELIPKKFKKFLQILKKKMKKNDILTGINFYYHEFANKKRVKYPWTSVEVKSAIDHFKKLIINLR